MRLRPFVLAAALVTTTLAATAHADRVETTPVLYKSGDSVSLQVLGVMITLPYAPAGWALSTANETNSSYDILRRQDPTNPAVQVDFNRPNSTCAQAAVLFDKLAQIGVKRNSASPLAPPNWEAWSYELPPSGGKSTLKLCTSTPTGTVLANISYEGSASALDPSYVRPLLEEVGRAVNGKRSGGGMVEGHDDSVVGTKVTLEVTGVTIMLPSNGWHAKVFTGNDGHRVDLVERIDPKDPWLFILIDKKPGRCNLTPKGNSHFVDSPPYLPPGWSKRAVELSTSNGLAGGLMCVNVSGSYIVATVSFMGSLDSAEVIGTRAILAPIAAGHGDGSSDDTSSASSDDTPSSDDDSSSRKGAHGRLEIGGTQVTPSADGFDKPSGVLLAIELLTNSNKGKTWGLGIDMGASVGIGGSGFIPWDARIGLGPSIMAGPLLVVPLFGIGGDAVNGNDTAFRIKSAFYYYYGGQAVLRFTDVFGVGAGFTLHGRGVKEEQVNGITLLPVNRETRFDIRLLFKSFTLGFRYTDYANTDGSIAKQLSATVGFPF